MKGLELTEQDRELIINALNSLGAALGEYNHVWSNDERRAYEKAVRILKSEQYARSATDSQ